MGIRVDKIDDGLPISVIIPYNLKRKNFFENMVLPMIEANNPNEIIINDNVGGSQRKRNDGFNKSTQPYVFFCDDDIVLPANYLDLLYKTISKHVDNKKIGYTYTGYYGVVMNPNTHPHRGNFTTESIHFNSELLRRGNYISTMSLMKREVFPFFDENINRFQDWDLYLTLLNKGIEGVLTENTFFYAYYLDEGITSNKNNINDALLAIKHKHNI